MSKLFHLCTFVSDISEYQTMLESAASRGFTSENTIIEAFDNTIENKYDPYQSIENVVANTNGRYVIIAHQDIRFNLGYGASELSRQLAFLDSQHPNWCIAGNAGVDRFANLVLHLDDPHGVHRYSKLPAKVYSLDENILIFKACSGLKLSRELSGFHLYGTDACLNAIIARKEAYVIDFLVTHLSRGNNLSEDFDRSRQKFIDSWRKRLLVGLIVTTCTQMHISKFWIIQQALRSSGIRRLIRNFNLGVTPCASSKPKMGSPSL